MLRISNIKWMALKWGKLHPIVNHYNLPSSIKIVRPFISLPDAYKPYSITRTFQKSPVTLSVEFKDSLTADFHYIWLRDNCPCKKCVHSQTKQKILDTLSLDLNIAPRFCSVTNTGKLKLVWPEGHGEHYSNYNPELLHRYAVGFERNLYESVHDCLPPVEYWLGESLNENLVQLEYEEVMESERGIMSSIESIHKTGVLILRNVPCEPGEMIKVMDRITHVKNTRWGTSVRFNTSDSFISDVKLPDTEKNVDFRTEMAYLEKSPGIQAFHCLGINYKDASDNGDEKASVLYLVDGFALANLFKEQHPIYFETLSSLPVKFRLFAKDMHYFNYQPIFRLNRSRIITEIHFNNRMMAPLEGPSSSIYDFYSAYMTFGEMIRKSGNQYKISLKEGDMVILNNRRVLHGREILDLKQMSKEKELCYADMDEVLARYRCFLVKGKTEEK